MRLIWQNGIDFNGDVETDQRWPSSYAEVTNKNTGTRIRTRTAADTAFPEWEEMLEIPVMSPEVSASTF